MTGRGLFLAGMILAVTVAAEAAPKADLPDAGFNGDHYAPLWTKSPFAIATPDAPAVSTDYRLVGIAKFDGITYVSLIDKQTQEHFILTSDKPVRNLKLVSVSQRSDGMAAVIQRGNESLTLRPEEEPASTAAPPTPTPFLIAPQNRPGQGGALSSVGGVVPPAFLVPPPVRIHRPLIRIPPPSQQPPISQPPPQQAPGQ